MFKILLHDIYIYIYIYIYTKVAAKIRKFSKIGNINVEVDLVEDPLASMMVSSAPIGESVASPLPRKSLAMGAITTGRSKFVNMNPMEERIATASPIRNRASSSARNTLSVVMVDDKKKKGTENIKSPSQSLINTRKEKEVFVLGPKIEANGVSSIAIKSIKNSSSNRKRTYRETVFGKFQTVKYNVMIISICYFFAIILSSLGAIQLPAKVSIIFFLYRPK